MRQLFTVRFFAAIGALALLAWAAQSLLVNDNQLAAVRESDPVTHRIDLIAQVFMADTSDDFRVGADGATRGYVDFTLDNRKVMRVAPGTPSDIDCRLTAVSSCVVFVDLLGDAVVWFAVRPRAETATVELPPIVDLEDGYAVFENGWEIKYPPVIERRCEGEDIVSFSDFLRRFGPGSTTVVDIETQQVVRVRCAGEDRVVPTVPTTVVAVEVPDVGIQPAPGDPLDENDGIVITPATTP